MNEFSNCWKKISENLKIWELFYFTKIFKLTRINRDGFFPKPMAKRELKEIKANLVELAGSAQYSSHASVGSQVDVWSVE